VRRLLLVLTLGALTAPALVLAEEDLTKQQIIDRSAPICRDFLEAIEPHIEKADAARAKEQWERYIHEGRLAISAARPYGRELRRLQPETGARKYGRFLDHTRAGVDSLERAFDALEAGRAELAARRREAAQEHFRRAKRAAKRYGLRRPCIKVVS
jgi:hypothetical protein